MSTLGHMIPRKMMQAKHGSTHQSKFISLSNPGKSIGMVPDGDVLRKVMGVESRVAKQPRTARINAQKPGFETGAPSTIIVDISELGTPGSIFSEPAPLRVPSVSVDDESLSLQLPRNQTPYTKLIHHSHPGGAAPKPGRGSKKSIRPDSRAQAYSIREEVRQREQQNKYGPSMPREEQDQSSVQLNSMNQKRGRSPSPSSPAPGSTKIPDYLNGIGEWQTSLDSEELLQIPHISPIPNVPLGPALLASDLQPVSAWPADTHAMHQPYQERTGMQGVGGLSMNWRPHPHSEQMQGEHHRLSEKRRRHLTEGFHEFSAPHPRRGPPGPLSPLPPANVPMRNISSLTLATPSTDIHWEQSSLESVHEYLNFESPLKHPDEIRDVISSNINDSFFFDGRMSQDHRATTSHSGILLNPDTNYHNLSPGAPNGESPRTKALSNTVERRKTPKASVMPSPAYVPSPGFTAVHAKRRTVKEFKYTISKDETMSDSALCRERFIALADTFYPSKPRLDLQNAASLGDWVLSSMVPQT